MVTVVWLIVAFVATAAGTRQARPDFAGQWVLLESAGVSSEIPREIDVSGSLGRPITVLTVTRRSATEEWSSTYNVGLIGGSVSGINPGAVVGRGVEPIVRTFVAAFWEGDTLVLEEAWHQSTAGGPEVSRERREEWSLDPAGALLIEVSERGTNNEVRRTTVRYRRK